MLDEARCEACMAEITIEFNGEARALSEFSFALFETEVLGARTQKEIADGGTITMQQMMARKAYGIPQFIEVVLSTVSGAAAGVASDYICEKLKKHKGGYLTIRINRRAVTFDKGKINKMIAEEMATHRRHYRGESGRSPQ
jgi:hypothetical protein